jgi:hypothetical protein
MALPGKIVGSDSKFVPILFAFQLLAVIVVGTLLAVTGNDDAVGVITGNVTGNVTGIDSFPSQSSLRPVGVVTCVFMIMWYIFLGHQVGLNGKPGEVAKQAKFIADRSVANTLEQSIPFLVTMWMEAFFVNPKTAWVLGTFYVIMRYLYPVMYSMYGEFTVMVELSTQANYVVIYYFLIAVFIKCVWGVDCHKEAQSSSVFWNWPIALGCGILAILVFMCCAAPTLQCMLFGVKTSKDIDDEDEDFDPEE